VNRGFEFMTQMGGEGAAWLGMAPFVERGHIFQNIGDGTYFHSGALAVQACVAAGVNITYKLLFNGHVAMTGGQAVSGALSIPELTKKLQAEGVRKTIVLAEEPDLYRNVAIASNAEVRDRSELPATLVELEKIPGVTMLIYDQQCAAEKRRMRSRGKLKEPVQRLVIHEEVCEGCGDCVKQSNCVSLQPVQTVLGQKMRIHQSSCNKDYSCALGDCPSFVTVTIKEGTGLARPSLPSLPDMQVPRPEHMTAAGESYRIVMPGIGGTGVVTVNALLATAALIDGKSVATLDQTGLAQKGGAVVSHIVISDKPIALSSKVNAGNADLLLGFDLLGAASAENLKCAHPQRTVAVVNSDVTPTAESIRKRVVLSGPERLVDRINDATQRGRNLFVDANRLADRLFGSHLRVNIFLLGAAYQAGLIPVSEEAFNQAIALNGVDADQNLRAFQWGRKYYLDAEWVEQQCASKADPQKPQDNFAFRHDELKRYHNEAYAKSYEQFVRSVEARVPELAPVVERYLFKLMAYKDEYEVARLLTKPKFQASVRSMWQNAESISYNLHPPLLRRFGFNKKIRIGAWANLPLRALAACKVVRGTPLDLFGMTAHRREERSLIAWYRQLIEDVISSYAPEKRALAIEIASLPDQIRGYEEIKSDNIRKVKQTAQEKLTSLRMNLSVATVV
jgi:indolepyruvate ferredoxin oxidoreductase